MTAWSRSPNPAAPLAEPPHVSARARPHAPPARTPHFALIRNGQYSIAALKNASGTIVERYSYAAYGSARYLSGSSSHAWEHLYTGRSLDATSGLYSFRHRMYHPELGRWCSRDPIGYGEGLNLYSASSGLAHTDPTGTTRCRAVLQRGATPPSGNLRGPSGRYSGGRYTGQIRWQASNSGVSLGARAQFGSRGNAANATGSTSVSVACRCDGCKCKAYGVIGGVGIGNIQRGDQRSDVEPFNPDDPDSTPLGDAGSQQLGGAHSLLGGYASGDTITVYGTATWKFTDRTWYRSYTGVFAFDDEETRTVRVSFTWKCKGTCP